MNGSADLFDSTKAAQTARRRRGPRPLGFQAALALVVKYGRLAEQNARRGHERVERLFAEGERRRPTHSARLAKLSAAPRLGPLFEAERPSPDSTVATRECPRCGHVGPLEQDFGCRVLKDGRRPQSWCRKCRAQARKGKVDGGKRDENLELLAAS